MRDHAMPTTIEVGTQRCSQELSPCARAVYRLITEQLNDPLNRSKSGSASIKATENREEFYAAIRAFDEAARAFQDEGWRTDVRHHEGIRSKKFGRTAIIHESYTILVLR